MAHDVYPGWRPARVVQNRRVAAGSMWLTLEAIDDWAAAYEPGHVLSLGLSLEDGFIRHAYTVSRGEFRIIFIWWETAKWFTWSGEHYTVLESLEKESASKPILITMRYRMTQRSTCCESG